MKPILLVLGVYRETNFDYAPYHQYNRGRRTYTYYGNPYLAAPDYAARFFDNVDRWKY